MHSFVFPLSVVAVHLDPGTPGTLGLCAPGRGAPNEPARGGSSEKVAPGGATSGGNKSGLSSDTEKAPGGSAPAGGGTEPAGGPSKSYSWRSP